MAFSSYGERFRDVDKYDFFPERIKLFEKGLEIRPGPGQSTERRSSAEDRISSGLSVRFPGTFVVLGGTKQVARAR